MARGLYMEMQNLRDVLQMSDVPCGNVPRTNIGCPAIKTNTCKAKEKHLKTNLRISILQCVEMFYRKADLHEN